MNFNFLNPHFLWALPLCLLPILLHFLLKKPVKIFPFGDLRLLRKIVLKTSPRRKFEEWLILFLRVLTLLALVLFFSRPVFHFGALAGHEGDSMTLILLLDSSYSMQKEEKGIKIFDQAKNLAEKILTQLKAEDRSCLIVYSDKVTYFSGVLNNEHQELIRTIQNLKCAYLETEISSPLNQAYQILSESPSANKAIIVLSDLAKHGWEETQVENLKDFDPNVRLVFLKMSEDFENASIQKAQIFHDLSSNFLKTEVEVRNWGSKALALPISVEYFSRTNQFLKRKAEQLLNLSPFESQKVSITANENEPNITGRIVLGSDILETDNEVYFAQEFPEKIKILMVEEHAQMTALTGESYFLRQAYLTPPTPFELKTITLGEIKNENLKSFNMIFLIAPSLISDESAQELKEFVKAGGSLWICLGERSTPRNLMILDDVLPCSFNQTIEPKALSLILKSSQDDADFNSLKSEYDWDKIRIYKMVNTALKLNAEPLISLSDGTPYLIFSKDKKVAVWASSMDRSWNNLAGKPVFAPLMRKLALWSSQTNSFREPFNLKVGEPFRTKAILAWQNNSMTLLSPSQEKIELHFSTEEIVSDPILEPGIYTLSGLDIKKGRFEKKFAVNLAKDKESDLKTMKEDDLKKIFPKTQWKILEPNEEFINSLFSYLKGKELNQVLILLSALFLLMEIFLISNRKFYSKSDIGFKEDNESKNQSRFFGFIRK
ncbi:MAG: VWA domain-containing protein [Elusimicrobia bacterium]|nr:VWA domain-containing protein [Elusimicrobiota bacterium]